jgi:hypothetical protein
MAKIIAAADQNPYTEMMRLLTPVFENQSTCAVFTGESIGYRLPPHAKIEKYS